MFALHCEFPISGRIIRDDYLSSVMDSNSIWLIGRSFSRPDSQRWEEGITLTKGDRNLLSRFLTSAFKDLGEIIMGNHKLFHQMWLPENNTRQHRWDQCRYCRRSGSLAAAMPVSVYRLVFGLITTFPCRILCTGLFFRNLLLHSFSCPFGQALS